MLTKRHNLLPIRNMFLLFSLLLFFYILFVAANQDGAVALRKSFLIAAMLLPVWMTYNVRSIRLDFRIMQAVMAGVVLFLAPPSQRMAFRPCLADLIIALLITAMGTSQYLNNALAPLTMLDISLTMVTSYVVGRIFFQSAQDVRVLYPTLAGMILLVTALAVIESITRINPLNDLLGKRFGILETGEGYRWGLKRSQGNLSHPIYHGIQLLLFLPFAVELARHGWSGTQKRWYWILTPLMLAAAVLVTISRGAHFGFLISTAVTTFLLLPGWRLVLGTAAIVGCGLLFLAQDYVATSLATLAGENGREPRLIVIDGTEVEYTGTKHRILLSAVYRDPLRNAGYFGWGGAMHGVRIEPDLQSRFGSIDNHYIRFRLQYGLIGTALFALLVLTVTCYAIHTAWMPSEWQAIAAGLAGGFLATAILMSTVWFSPDYGAIWMFCAGLSANIRTLSSDRMSARGSTIARSAQNLITRHRIPVTHVAGVA
jgi:hypothetical protein